METGTSGISGKMLSKLKSPDMRMTLALLAALFGLSAILSFVSPSFLTSNNILSLLRQVSMPAIIAVGMTMIIICAEIDLSVGSMVAFTSCLVAYLAINMHIPLPAAIVLTLLAGAIVGALVGVIRVSYKIPSFIITLALYSGLRGGAYLLTDGFPISPFPEWFSFLGGGYIADIPVPVIITMVIFAAGYFITTQTAYGRYIYAVGGNEEAARLSGINVAVIKISVFAITGFLAAFSGIILSSRLMSGTPSVAVSWELDVIASVIVGGTNLFGGAGSILGTLLGVLFIGVLTNGMVLLGVSPYSQLVVRGFVILFAVWFGFFQAKFNRK